MPAWITPGRNRNTLRPAVSLAGIHFHPAHADPLYTPGTDASIRRKVVVYDGKSGISPADRVPCS